MAAGERKSPQNSVGRSLRVDHLPRTGLEDRVRRNGVEPPRAHDVRRPDETVGRAEVYKVANLVNGPTDKWLNAIADWSQNSAATTAFFRSATATTSGRRRLAAFATRTTIGRLAGLNWHGARDAIAGDAIRAAKTNDEQYRCEYSSRDASMNDR